LGVGEPHRYPRDWRRHLDRTLPHLGLYLRRQHAARTPV